MDTKELEALNLFLGVCLALLGLAGIEGEVVVLAPYCQVSMSLVFRPTTIVSSANVMMVLELCVAMPSWVNRQCRRRLRAHP